MKKIEEEFLNDYSLKTDGSFSDIKDSIVNNVTLKSKKINLKLVLIISSIVLLVLVTLVFIPVKIQADEYKEAISFFEDNQLSSEGLTKIEIILVYRDIKTNSFKYNKTGDVISNSITTTIPGYEISQIDPKRQDYQYMWEYWKKLVSSSYLIGSGFKIINKEVHWENGERIDRVTKIIKYNESEIIWETDLYDYYTTELRIYDNILMAYSYSVYSNYYLNNTYVNPTNDVKMKTMGHILFISPITGEIIKQIDFNNAEEFETGETEYPRNIVKNEDGTYTLISRVLTSYPGDKYISLMTFDINGNILNTYFESIDYNISAVIRFNDGFLILSTSNKIIKIDNYGKKLEEYTYENDKYLYYITDIIEYNGKIYLSTYYVDKEKNKTQNYWGEDTYGEGVYINKYVRENGKMKDNEDVTDLFRNEYHASLLVCDRVDGTPEEFYSIKGALGYYLYLNQEGKLVWEVGNISRVMVSIATSSYTYGGTTEEYEYVFSQNGKLENIIDTGSERILRK